MLFENSFPIYIIRYLSTTCWKQKIHSLLGNFIEKYFVYGCVGDLFSDSDAHRKNKQTCECIDDAILSIFYYLHSIFHPSVNHSLHIHLRSMLVRESKRFCKFVENGKWKRKKKHLPSSLYCNVMTSVYDVLSLHWFLVQFIK